MAKRIQRKSENDANLIIDASGRIPPSSKELEEVVLSGLINDSSLLGKYTFLNQATFYNVSNGLIFKALKELNDAGKSPDVFILIDYLKSQDLLETVGGAGHIMLLAQTFVPDISTHAKIIRDKYHYRQLIAISYHMQKECFSTEFDALQIADEAVSHIMKVFEFDYDAHNNMLNAVKTTLNNIKASSRGDNFNLITSGHAGLDRAISFRASKICIVAGPEGSGKTKFVTALVRGMLDNEKDLAVQWFSFEDDREQIIRAFLAMDLRITTKELQSINYELTETAIADIVDTAKQYESFNIEFHDKITNINTIVARCKRFSTRNQKSKKVVIIDNLGLIQSDRTGIDRDDYLAARIKDMADNYNVFIFLVHHFTKEIARKANLDDGYRPRKEYLKGSTRILDYVQHALLVNLPNKYPDLLSEEKQLELNFIANKDIPFTDENYDKYLWSINPQRDKDTKDITDIRVAAYVKLRALLSNKERDIHGKEITFSYIVQKYTEYCNMVDIRNKGREAKYLQQKASLYTFIVRRMFNESFIVNVNAARSQYLYGRNKNLKNHIDELFIVESTKNRDDDNTEENAIFRYIVDLGYNIFKEIPDDGRFGK